MQTIKPIHFLAELRREVLAHSDSRMPKWKFRIAPNLIIQLQPNARLVTRSTMLRLFNGFALMIDGANRDVGVNEGLQRKRSALVEGKILYQQQNRIAADLGTLLRRRVLEARRGTGWLRGSATPCYRNFPRRILDRLTASAMLAPHCLICGKGLTDPASMARFIGPECAGTSSLRVPRVIKAEAA